MKLYTKRWLVEVDLFFIKKIMDMDILRTKTPGMVIKEFYIGLIAYNILRSIIAQSAWKQGVLPRSLSFKGALQAFSEFAPKLSNSVSEMYHSLYNELMKVIVQHRIGNRAGRHEPRAIKRKRKTFPALSKKRKELKEEIDVKAETMPT